MRINKKIIAGEVVDVNKVGNELAVIKSSGRLFVSGFDYKGRKTIETELQQGDVISSLQCAMLQFETDTTQEFIIWYSNFKYSFNKQSDRIRRVKGYEKPLKVGVNNLFEQDPARISAVVTPDVDLYIGGEDLQISGDNVLNARKFKAGEDVKLDNYGVVKYFVTNNAEQVFYNTDLSAKFYTQRYGDMATRSELEVAGVDFFDVEVPESMSGVQFIIKADVTVRPTPEMNGDNHGYMPFMYATKNDISSSNQAEFEELVPMGGFSLVTNKDVTNVAKFYVTLSAGVHRFFVLECTQNRVKWDALGYVDFDRSRTFVTNVRTSNPAFLSVGSVAVLEQRT